MTAAQYKSEREKRGTRQEVANLLGIHVMTIIKRENDMRSVPPEAEKALLSLPILKSISRAKVLAKS